MTKVKDLPLLGIEFNRFVSRYKHKTKTAKNNKTKQNEKKPLKLDYLYTEIRQYRSIFHRHNLWAQIQWVHNLDHMFERIYHHAVDWTYI